MRDAYWICSKCGNPVTRKPGMGLLRKRRTNLSGWDHWPSCNRTDPHEVTQREQRNLRLIARERDESI